jgi:hypothetical protein
MMKHICAASLVISLATPCLAQQSQRTNIKGNTEINVSTKNLTAVAVGEGNVAKNRVGVIQGEKRGDTNINVAAGNVTTVVGGRNRKACTNIGGIVSDDCK